METNSQIICETRCSGMFLFTLMDFINIMKILFIDVSIKDNYYIFTILSLNNIFDLKLYESHTVRRMR